MTNVIECMLKVTNLGCFKRFEILEIPRKDTIFSIFGQYNYVIPLS